MGNCCAGQAGNTGAIGSSLALGRKDPDSHKQLAKETHFNVDEVYALAELYKSVSNSLHQDGVIQKDEFMQALFNMRPGQVGPNLFADRLFLLFDLKQNNIVDFGEFVRSLSVFHPKAPLEEKAQFAFRIYDLDNTGDIQPSEVKRLLVALLHNNPDLALDDATIGQIIDQTFEEADLAKDGRISNDEWHILVKKDPTIVSFMTIPLLRDVTKRYPSFIFNKQT